MDYNRIAHLAEAMIRKLTGGISRSDQSRLDEWLDGSPRHRELYRRLLSGESHRWHAENFPPEDDEYILQGVRRRIAAARRRRIALRAAGAAAVLSAVAGAFHIYTLHMEIPQTGDSPIGHRYHAVMTIGGGLRVALSEPGRETEWKEYTSAAGATPDSCTAECRMIRIEVPRGSSYSVRLDDSTLVWLNAETVIEYPEKFSGPRRRVSLSGEACFEVSHAPDMPFAVTMPDGVEVTVLGTRFNVHSYDDMPDTRITLIDGSVAVRAGPHQTRINPCEQAVVDRNGLGITVRRLPDTRVFTCWTEGLFLMADAPLKEIFAGIGRWYGLEIACDDPAGMERMGLFTVRASHRDKYTAVFDALRDVTGLEYTIAGRNVSVKLPSE